MLALAVPMLIFFEISIVIGRIIARHSRLLEESIALPIPETQVITTPNELGVCANVIDAGKPILIET
jgi:hypothetical protein